MDRQWGGVYKPVRLDAQGRVEQQLGGAERRLGRAERRLGRAERRLGGAAEATELLGVPLTITPPFQNCIDPMQMVEVE